MPDLGLMIPHFPDGYCFMIDANDPRNVCLQEPEFKSAFAEGAVKVEG
jgi:hypothetical protein